MVTVTMSEPEIVSLASLTTQPSVSSSVKSPAEGGETVSTTKTRDRVSPTKTRLGVVVLALGRSERLDIGLLLREWEPVDRLADQGGADLHSPLHNSLSIPSCAVTIQPPFVGKKIECSLSVYLGKKIECSL